MQFIIIVVAFLGALSQAAVPERRPPHRSPGLQLPFTIPPLPFTFPSASANARNQTLLGRRLAELDDIKYTKEQLEWLNTPPELRSGVKFPNDKWPKAIVPYKIASSVPRDQRRLIPKGLKWIEDATCIRFVRRTNEKNYVEIFRKERGACWANLGFLGQGRQEMNLGGWDDGKPCEVATIAHEMMHTLGIEHEQNRPDRDDYIRIDFEKIPKDWRSQYQKDDPNQRSVYGQPYGYDSIMHYDVWGFPPNSDTQVMFPLDESVDINIIGQRKRLAKTDVALMNAMYC